MKNHQPVTGNKKKILFFVSSMQSGGAERVASLLCNYWVEQGHTVTLVATFSGRGKCDYELSPEIDLVFLADSSGQTASGISGKTERFLSIRRLVKRTQPDMVLSFLTRLNVIVLMATVGLSVPVYVSERIHPAVSGASRFWKTMRRIMYRRAKTIIVQTQGGADWIKENCPGTHAIAIENPLVYPLPIVTPVLKVDDVIKPGRRIILAAGRLTYQKGFDLLIKAFSNLKSRYPEWDLVIAGEGRKRHEFAQLADNLGVSGQVYLPGRIGNLADWYQRSELFVLSSRHEGFPNVLLEAMSYGIAVISFNCASGPSEIIQNGVNGILVEPSGGEIALESELDKLMADEDNRKRLGSQAEGVRKTFSFSTVGAKWDAALYLNRS